MKETNILITSAGRSSYIVDYFKQVLRQEYGLDVINDLPKQIVMWLNGEKTDSGLLSAAPGVIMLKDLKIKADNRCV